MHHTVYDGTKRQNPVRVGVLFSGSASSMQGLYGDSSHGNKYQIVCALTDKPEASGRAFAKDRRIPCESLSYKDFAMELKDSLPRGQIRKKYDEKVVKFMKTYQVEIVALSGYFLLVSRVLLQAFPYRILNVHPADLSIRYLDGTRVFSGDDAVVDAILLRQPHLCSTVHLVNEGTDAGPILTRSRPVIIDQKLVRRLRKTAGLDATAEWARGTVQEKMKEYCDGPAFVKALQILADSLVEVDPETEEIFVNGEKLPYEGIQLKPKPIYL